MTDTRETDLFGNPVRPRTGKRGRPRRQVTEQELDMIESGLARGWSTPRIAEATRIPLSTLKRNFGPILKGRASAPDRLKLALYASTVRKALEGHTPAVALALRMIREDEAMEIDARIRKGDEDQPEEPAGKKALAQREAERAIREGSWGADLDPARYN